MCTYEGNEFKYAHVIFTKDKYSKVVKTNDIKCDRQGKINFKPNSINDFIENKKYYVPWYDCTSKGDKCCENHDHEYDYYSAYITCLGETVDSINEAIKSGKRNRFPNRKYLTESTESDNAIKNVEHDSMKEMKEATKTMNEIKQKVMKERNESVLKKLDLLSQPIPFKDVTYENQNSNTESNIGSNLPTPIVRLQKMCQTNLFQKQSCVSIIKQSEVNKKPGSSESIEDVSQNFDSPTSNKSSNASSVSSDDGSEDLLNQLLRAKKRHVSSRSAKKIYSDSSSDKSENESSQDTARKKRRMSLQSKNVTSEYEERPRLSQPVSTSYQHDSNNISGERSQTRVSSDVHMNDENIDNVSNGNQQHDANVNSPTRSNIRTSPSVLYDNENQTGLNDLRIEHGINENLALNARNPNDQPNRANFVDRRDDMHDLRIQNQNNLLNDFPIEHVANENVADNQENQNHQPNRGGPKRLYKRTNQFILECVQFYVRPANDYARQEVEKRYTSIGTDEIYLGENIAIAREAWDVLLVEKPSIFVTTLAVYLWGGDEVLANRALDLTHGAENIPNRSPVKLIENNLLRLLMSLYYDFLKRDKTLKNKERGKLLSNVIYCLRHKIRNLRLHEKEQHFSPDQKALRKAKRRLRYNFNE